MMQLTQPVICWKTLADINMLQDLQLNQKILMKFVIEFQKYVNDNISDDMLVPEIEIDANLYISDINFNFYKILKTIWLPFWSWKYVTNFFKQKMSSTQVMQNTLAKRKISI